MEKKEMMDMNYCMECGTKLELRDHKGEGVLPFCTGCGKFWHPVYNTAVINIVVDRAVKKILLIRQYGRPWSILVAGYVEQGESAEQAAAREIQEETGLEVESIEYNRSEFFARSNSLMLNFTCFVKDASELCTNEEIDSCAWYTYEEARAEIKPDSLAQKFLNEWLDRQNEERDN